MALSQERLVYSEHSFSALGVANPVSGIRCDTASERSNLRQIHTWLFRELSTNSVHELRACLTHKVIIVSGIANCNWETKRSHKQL